MINNYNSKNFPKAMTSGVPQGSCIGPLMFIAYVNDIDFQLKYFIISKYVDIKLDKVIRKHNSQIETSMLQTDLKALYEWSADWQLRFSVSKYSIIHPDHLNLSQLHTLDRDHLLAKNIKKDLGVALSIDIKFTIYAISAV